MNMLLHLLLPARAFGGVKLPAYVFGVIAGLSTARSLIHLLAHDGGAGSIAGIDLAKAGKSGTLFGFGLWGSAQLLYALIQVVVISRYRSLVPLMYVLLILETLLRAFAGRTKPVPLTRTPPGATGNALLLPLAVCMLASARRQEEQVA